MTDKYDERAKSVFSDLITPFVDGDMIAQKECEIQKLKDTQTIAAALREAVEEAKIDTLKNCHEGYLSGCADAAKIADGIICTGTYADGTFSICNKEIAADIRARAQEVAG